jgi:hypothetical protein
MKPECQSTAIMQPYIFPYIGYFNLINSSDNFIFLDNVNYIKKGWINKNRILSNNNIMSFTISLAQSSQNKLINEIKVYEYEKFKIKFIKTLQQSYSKSKNYKKIINLINEIFEYKPNTISDLCIYSTNSILNYLGINTKTFIASVDFKNIEKKDINNYFIEILKELKSKTYINMIDGKDLYNKDLFIKNGISLKFLDPIIKEYDQNNNQFNGRLSIIDLLMNIEYEEIKIYLDSYNLKDE